jgi:hypothetical protein
MHLMQIAVVTFGIVFRDNSYHRRPHLVHWDGTLSEGEHQLELSTFTGILLAGEVRRWNARERVSPCGHNKTTMLT